VRAVISPQQPARRLVVLVVVVDLILTAQVPALVVKATLVEMAQFLAPMPQVAAEVDLARLVLMRQARKEALVGLVRLQVSTALQQLARVAAAGRLMMAQVQFAV
jgi:hypothetical protein